MISRPAQVDPRPAIVWLTHFNDAAGVAAFSRLEQQAQAYGRVYGMQHVTDSGALPTDGRFIWLTRQDFDEALPSRSNGFGSEGQIPGRMDLLHMAAIRLLPPHEHYWFIEYDVDFSGDWGTFFAAFQSSGADVVGTTLFPRSIDTDWVFWPIFNTDASCGAECHTRAFFPIIRLSRRFAKFYIDNVANGWTGHYESIYPTMAVWKNFTIEDIGGSGPFVPAGRTNRFYTNTLTPLLTPGTFHCDPIFRSYYTQGHPDFPVPDQLWHPVKTETFRRAAKRINKIVH